MATGTIKQTDTTTTGIITVIDNAGNAAVANGSDITYFDADLPSKGGANPNDVVVFDIVLVGRTYQAVSVSRVSATGKVKQTDTTTSGIIAVSDNGGFANISNGSEVSYLDMDLPSKGGVAQNDTVSFNFTPVGRGYQAINLKKMISIPGDEGTVRTGDISGNVSVTSGTVTLKGATVTGKVDVKSGAKVIIKPSDTGAKTVINKGLNANQNSIVVFFQSDILGTVVVNNSQSFTATGGSIGSSLVLVNDAAVSVDGTSVDGDVVVNNSTTSAVVKNCNVTGNLEMHNNTGCSNTGNTVGGTNSGCA